MVLQEIYQKCYDYYSQIPGDTLPKIAKSALYTFAASYLFSPYAYSKEPFNIARPLFAAGVAALASFIYALTVPMFNAIFGDNRVLIHRELIKQVVNITLVSVLVNYLTSRKVSLIATPLIGSLSMNLLKSIFELIPTIAEVMFNEQDFAEESRELFRSFGVYAEPGTSSVLLNFGIFPSLGME